MKLRRLYMKNQQFVYLLALVILYLLYTRYQQIEEWSPYMSCPFKNWETAPTNSVYYPKTRYRKPYLFPYKFKSSYPVEHDRHWEQKY